VTDELASPQTNLLLADIVMEEIEDHLRDMLNFLLNDFNRDKLESVLKNSLNK